MFEERSRFLTLLKDKCVTAARKHYSNAIDPEDAVGGNQMEYFQLIHQRIEELIGEKSLFHLGKPDVMVCQLLPCTLYCLMCFKNKPSNLMHSCIEDVCVDFYYCTGADALARESNEFQHSVPERAVALVVACVPPSLCSLSMIANQGFDVDL